MLLFWRPPGAWRPILPVIIMAGVCEPNKSYQTIKFGKLCNQNTFAKLNSAIFLQRWLFLQTCTSFALTCLSGQKFNYFLYSYSHRFAIITLSQIQLELETLNYKIDIIQSRVMNLWSDNIDISTTILWTKITFKSLPSDLINSMKS